LRLLGQLRLAPPASRRKRAGAFGTAGFVARILLIAALGAGLAACGSGRNNNQKLGERVIPLGQPVPKGGGAYTIGQPYEIAGIWYTPREDAGYDRVGSASWYGELFHGRRTANSEIYDMDRLSAAHPTLPLPVYARVTNLNNGRSIVVRINDRGPFARDRIIDLSRRSAELLGFRSRGTATVRVKYLGRAPLNGDDSYERKYLASQSWVHLALKRKSGNVADLIALGSLAKATLPLENPDNLSRRWKATGLREETGNGAPAAQDWKATRRTVETTGALSTAAVTAASGGPIIQAGSFKNKENAERARNALSAIAPVDVTPMAVGGEVYFRVRVGPFSSTAEARSAMAKVTGAGYRGAKVMTSN
jgi:rare lipoprotein A